MRLYGSSWSGFGLKTANVNLDLQITPDQKPHLALLKALEVLSSCQEFHSVTDEFTLKIPTIKFSTHSNMACELSLNNVQPFQTSSLLRDYWHLDSRVRTLGVALRYWASLVRLDRQAEGSLPPHSFAILLVHFLQQLPHGLGSGSAFTHGFRASVRVRTDLSHGVGEQRGVRPELTEQLLPEDVPVLLTDPRSTTGALRGQRRPQKGC